MWRSAEEMGHRVVGNRGRWGHQRNNSINGDTSMNLNSWTRQFPRDAFFLFTLYNAAVICLISVFMAFLTISPAYRVAVRLEPWSVPGSEMGGGALVWPGQQWLGRVNWRGGGHEYFVGGLRPDDLLSSGLVRGVWPRPRHQRWEALGSSYVVDRPLKIQ